MHWLRAMALEALLRSLATKGFLCLGKLRSTTALNVGNHKANLSIDVALLNGVKKVGEVASPPRRKYG